MNYRSEEFRRLCYEFSCLLQIPGVCTGGTGEPCHANWSVHGKGGAMKAHDCYVVPGCRACHCELDQGNRLSRETKWAVWTNAYWRFLPMLFERGLLRVATDAMMTSTGRRTLATKGNTKQDGLTREQIGKWLDKRGRKYAPPIKRVKRPEAFQR